MPGYNHGPITTPVIAGPVQPPGQHHFFDAFDFGHHGDGHALPVTHPNLGAGRPDLASYLDQGSRPDFATAAHELVQQFLDDHPKFLDHHPNIAAHLGIDFGGGLLAHNLPYWGHGDWAA
jgi:hypothetical protein